MYFKNNSETNYYVSFSSFIKYILKGLKGA